MVFTALASALEAGPAAGVQRLPKYLQLSDAIARAILQGRLKTGEKLPPENELARLLPASLGTIQRALNNLAERGLLVRRHGHGTFVAEPAMAPQDLWHFRFLADDGRSLLPVYTQVGSIEAVRRSGPWRDFLGTRDLIVVTRRIDVNHAHTGISELYLPEARVPGLLKIPPKDLENVNIRAFLADRFGIATERVREMAACGPLPGTVTGALGLAPDLAGLSYHMEGFEHRDRPISYQTAWFPPGGPRLVLGEKHE
ncbi:MAG: GntR family transcriptional regulator [Rhodospirillales bacterium]